MTDRSRLNPEKRGRHEAEEGRPPGRAVTLRKNAFDAFRTGSVQVDGQVEVAGIRRVAGNGEKKLRQVAAPGDCPGRRVCYPCECFLALRGFTFATLALLKRASFFGLIRFTDLTGLAL